jgi:O-antigen biosynthesis protein
MVDRGFRVVYTPHARLVHHESATRRVDSIPDSDAWNSFAAFRPWLIRGDPYYNPNLTMIWMDCSLRWDRRPPEDLALQVLAWDLPGTLALVG